MDNFATEKVSGKVILRHTGFWKWLLVTQLSRLTGPMTPMAFVIAGQYVAHSSALGGLMITVYIMCDALFSAPIGRLLDRYDVRKGVTICLVFASLVLTGLAVAVGCRAPMWAIFTLTGLAGGGAASVGGGLRTLLNRVVPKSFIAPALSIDSIAIEFVVIAAPLLVALFSGLSAAIVILTMALITLMTAVGSFSLPKEPMVELAGSLQEKENRSSGRLWSNKRFVFWIIVSTAFGSAFGGTEAGILPLVVHLHLGTGVAAILLDVISIASIVGGIGYTLFSHRLKLSFGRQGVMLIGVIVMACLGMAISGVLLTLTISMVFLGISTAPLNTVRSVAAQEEIPSDRQSEGFNYIGLAYSAGYALGGIFLAIFPLNWLFISSGILGAATLAISPMLLRGNNTWILNVESPK